MTGRRVLHPAARLAPPLACQVPPPAFPPLPPRGAECLAPVLQPWRSARQPGAASPALARGGEGTRLVWELAWAAPAWASARFLRLPPASRSLPHQGLLWDLGCPVAEPRPTDLLLRRPQQAPRPRLCEPLGPERPTTWVRPVPPAGPPPPPHLGRAQFLEILLLLALPRLQRPLQADLPLLQGRAPDKPGGAWERSCVGRLGHEASWDLSWDGQASHEDEEAGPWQCLGPQDSQSRGCSQC